MGIFKKVDEALKAEQAKTIAELKATPIRKHLGSLIVVGLIGWGVVSCTAEKSPEEVRASVEREYLDQCTRWGINLMAHEMGGAKKYKDRSLVHYYKAKEFELRDATLDPDQCTAAFLKGEQEGRRRFNTGKVDLQ